MMDTLGRHDLHCMHDNFTSFFWCVANAQAALMTHMPIAALDFIVVNLPDDRTKHKHAASITFS